MKTSSQILSYTKNEESQQWEFMILNIESGDKNVKLGPMSIDYGLQCLTVVDNNNQLLKAIDLRKFKLINEFKVTQ